MVIAPSGEYSVGAGYHYLLRNDINGIQNTQTLLSNSASFPWI